MDLLVAPVNEVYRNLSGETGTVGISYFRSWEGELLDALARSRVDDVRTGIAQVGPQRDDLSIFLAGRPARSCGSQGEQRCLALALRLGLHRVAASENLCAGGDRIRPSGTPVPDPPILLLDDVFSELDPHRSAALAASLPGGQVFISAAGELPPDLAAATTITVSGGRIHQ